VSIQDEALANRVRTSLMQDKRTAGQAIGVRVADGDVFLKGVVDLDELRDLARLVVRGIPGVRQVNVEELRVREAAT